jgi:hypothetical protein
MPRKLSGPYLMPDGRPLTQFLADSQVEPALRRKTGQKKLTKWERSFHKGHSSHEKGNSERDVVELEVGAVVVLFLHEEQCLRRDPLLTTIQCKSCSQSRLN